MHDVISDRKQALRLLRCMVALTLTATVRVLFWLSIFLFQALMSTALGRGELPAIWSIIFFGYCLAMLVQASMIVRVGGDLNIPATIIFTLVIMSFIPGVSLYFGARIQSRIALMIEQNQLSHGRLGWSTHAIAIRFQDDSTDRVQSGSPKNESINT